MPFFPSPQRLLTLVAIVLAPFAQARATDALASGLSRAAPGLNPQVLALATRAVRCTAQPRLPATLSVIDYSLPSTQPRLWVFDLASRQLLFNELVAHGKGTGENIATRFSNRNGSNMSSIGAFEAEQPYIGHNGYSLRLRGLEPGWNDQAESRAIVMHGAAYVNDAIVRTQGRLGRSLGCPAVRPSIARALIDRIRDGGFIFSYYPDSDWLAHSRLLQPDCGAGLAAN